MSAKSRNTAHPSMALVKYESSSRELVSLQSKNEPKPNKTGRISKINTPFSSTVFITSHLILLLVSLLFLGGLYYLLNKDNFNNSVVIDYLPISMKPSSFNLEVQTPEDESVVFSSTVTLSGKTTPKASLVAVVTTEKPIFSGFEADNQGNFKQVIQLTPGLNIIEVSSFDENGAAKTISQTVYFSEEPLP